MKWHYFKCRKSVSWCQGRSRKGLHFMRREGDCQLTALCFSLDISWHRIHRVLVLCCGRVCIFGPQRKSHTHRLTSAHFLSIECCEGKHQNRFVFCLHNDFVWRTQQTQVNKVFLPSSYHGLIITEGSYISKNHVFQHLTKHPSMLQH